jgi:hypothetical protein
MKKTLQDQYLLIKEGKGHKGVFLTEAKRQFPNIVRNAATFDEAVASLKTKNIISENVISVMPAIMDRPKKESYETAFEAFLAEAKKKNEDEKVKAEEKKVSKPVEEDLEKNFDYSDEKNPDNMIFDQIMMGYYAEMKDPKNADKTMQQLKDIVFKNLAKDPIYYTKDGQFGVKDLGYVTEHPGLGEPKEAKGKYKSSGYGDLKESINEIIYNDPQPNPLKDLTKMLVSAGINAELRWINYDFIRVDNDKYEISLQNGMYRVRALSKAGSPIVGEYNLPQEVVNYFTKPSSSSFPKEYRPFHIDRSLEETTLRKAIREMIDAELEEAGRGFATMGTINLKGGDGKIFIPQYHILPLTAIQSLDFSNPGENAPTYGQEYLIKNIRPFNLGGKREIVISKWFYDAINKKEDIKNPVKTKIKDLVDTNKEFKDFYGYIKNFIDDKPFLTTIDGKKIPYHKINVQVEPLKPWAKKELEKANVKLQKAKSGVVGRGRPINIKYLENFWIPTLEEYLSRPEGNLVVIPQIEEGVLGVRDIDVSPGYPVDLPISYSDDKNVAHYSDDDRYSSQEDLLDPEDYLEQIQGMSDGDAFNYLKGLGLGRGEILTVLKSRKSSLRESVEKDLMDINKEAEHEVLQTKLDKIDALIDLRRSKLGKLDEDEDMKALTDKKKVKELEKDIKKLEVARNKVEKMMSKFKGKKSSNKKVIDETEEDLDVAAEYVEDATERLDAGQKVDSIRDTYSNLGMDQKEDLGNYLNYEAPDDLKSDYVY